MFNVNVQCSMFNTLLNAQLFNPFGFPVSPKPIAKTLASRFRALHLIQVKAFPDPTFNPNLMSRFQFDIRSLLLLTAIVCLAMTFVTLTKTSYIIAFLVTGLLGIFCTALVAIFWLVIVPMITTEQGAGKTSIVATEQGDAQLPRSGAPRRNE